MSIPLIDLKAQYQSIKQEIDQAVAAVIDDGFFIGGEMVKNFEESFASYVGSRYCLGVGNGTDALEIALKSLGIGPGDEVIVPALSWISTATSVNNVGAEPVFVDVLEDERTIDPLGIEQNLTLRTKAIIPVHLYGLPARMDSISLIAKKHGLKVIEDCSQAHGAERNGQKVGTFGDMAVFSFYPTKNLGAFGDAGAILTDDADLAHKCRIMADYGRAGRNEYPTIGRNSRLDALQAAVLSAKLPHLDEWNHKRISVAEGYQLLNTVTRPVSPVGAKHVYHLYVIQSGHRNEIIRRMEEANVGYSIHYPTPLPFLDCYGYKNHQKGDFPMAEKLCREILSIPMFAELTEEEIAWVGEIINQ